MATSKQGKIASIAYGIGIVLALAWLVTAFRLEALKNPLRLDEVDYFQCMRNIVRLGLPLYYAGEVAVTPDRLLWLGSRTLGGHEFEFYRYKPETGILKETFFALTDGNSRYTYGMWHPPLYIYLGSLVFRLWPLTPENSIGLRAFNLVFWVGMLLGLVALSRELYPRVARPVFLLTLILYGLNGLAIRGAVLIDYSATLAPCIAVWFAYGFVHAGRTKSFSLGLAVVVFLAWFTSLGVAVALCLGAAVYGLVFARPRPPWTIWLSLIVGTGAFLPAFWIFCHVLELPFSQPFLHNFARAGIQLSLHGIVGQIQGTVTYVGRYLQEFGWLACVISLLFVARNLVPNRPDLSRGFLPTMVTVGLLSQGYLKADAYGFYKYIVFLLPLFFLYLAGEGIAWFRVAEPRWRKVLAALGALLLVTSLISAVHWIRRPGGTLYNPAEQGILAAAQWVQLASPPDAVILSPKDVGFFAERKFIQWSGGYLTDVALLQTDVEKEAVQFAVNTATTLESVSPAVRAYLQETFPNSEYFQSYVVLSSISVPLKESLKHGQWAFR